MNGFNSKWWTPHIKALAEKYFEKADKQVVVYNESFADRAMKEYARRLLSLKNEIYGLKCPVEKRIDGHKIIALYIQVFLEQPLFRVPPRVAPGGIFKFQTILINEHFCYDFMCIVFAKWYLPIDEYAFNEYKEPFFKLLFSYREYVGAYCRKGMLFRKNSELDSRYNLFTYKLANLIYFIEKNFTKSIL